jgi:hypothetical protein
MIKAYLVGSSHPPPSPLMNLNTVSEYNDWSPESNPADMSDDQLNKWLAGSPKDVKFTIPPIEQWPSTSYDKLTELMNG